MNKKALIFGISGQDGAYLAKFLISLGYSVYGTSRKEYAENLHKLNIHNLVNIFNVNIESYHEVEQLVTSINPDEIYYLASQSSVAISFNFPVETIKSCILGLLNILETCRNHNLNTKIYNAGSSECFGGSSGVPISETNIFAPKSPYAIGKSSSHWLVQTYREAYSIFTCTGFLFNHESRLRPNTFVTQKIISTAQRIATGSKESLILGRLDIYRDWGFAPEYVEAMWKILQSQEPDDFIIATGISYSLKDFVMNVFENLNLDWKKYVQQSEKFFRPNELIMSRADPSKAEQKLKWKAQKTMPEIVKCMLYELDE
ncbi:GDP-mannose 4,6-dehydratase [Acinetobacter sp. ANC 4640]